MSHTPHYDEKIKTILDATKPGERVCALTGKKWNMTEEEISWYRKFQVPPSRQSPLTRLSILLGFNTGLAFSWNKDYRNGKLLMSLFHPDLPFKIVEDQDWSKEDYLIYGKDIDFSCSFFDQVWELETTVPFRASRSRNSDETSIAIGVISGVRNYLTAGSLAVSDCFYSYALIESKENMDAVNGEHIERCFTVSARNRLTDCQYVFESSSCFNCCFLFDCQECESCFGAVNKRHKKYLWFDEPLTEQAWKERRSQVDLSVCSIAQTYKEKFYTFWKEKGVWPQAFWKNTQESSGEALFDCLRCFKCFWEFRSKDLFFCWAGVESSLSAFCTAGGWETDAYSCSGGIRTQATRFCLACTNTSLSEYCIHCEDCENCFGCVGLKQKRFCIFNKEYKEEEYWKKVDELKCAMLARGEYGEFFPAKFSLPGFPFSAGQIYLNYTQEQLGQFGAIQLDPRRSLILAPELKNKTPLSLEDLPDRLEDFDTEKFLNSPIYDKEADRCFSIVPKEIALRKRYGWAIGKEHFITRLTNLVRHSNSPIEISTLCHICQKEMISYKNHLFSERKILCQNCYLSYLEERG
jgi:hypothetical protein